MTASLREQPLMIGVVGDRLEISIGIDALAALLPGCDAWDSVDMTVIDPDAAARTIACGLAHEQDYGDSAIHRAIDDALDWAIDMGVLDGFGLADGDPL